MLRVRAWRRKREWTILSWSRWRGKLALRGVATLRCQFPYMERGAKRPDPPQLAQATVRAAVAVALDLLPGLQLIAGGKSFGGRMTSQAQAKAALHGVCGLAFLGFPLHPAGRPSQDRAGHLFEVQIPMLFSQGTRDALAGLDQLEPLCKKLGTHATLKLFLLIILHVPVRTGRKHAQVLGDVLDALAAWLDSVIARPGIILALPVKAVEQSGADHLPKGGQIVEPRRRRHIGIASKAERNRSP